MLDADSRCWIALSANLLARTLNVSWIHPASERKKNAAEAAFCLSLSNYSPGGFLNSWIAALLFRLSASTTFLAWSSPVWQPSQVA